MLLLEPREPKAQSLPLVDHDHAVLHHPAHAAHV